MKRIVLVLLTSLGAWLVTPSGVVLADDFGTGIEVEATHKIGKKLKVGVTGEYRTQNGLEEIENERWSLGADVSYKLYNKKSSKWSASAAAGYVFIDRYKMAHWKESFDASESSPYRLKHIDSYWSKRHRGYVQASLSREVGKNWEFTLRERYQYTYTMESDPVLRLHYKSADGETYSPTNKVQSTKVYGGTDKQLLRSRLQAKWSKKKLPWKPFANIEVLNDVKDGFRLDQTRYTIGTDYKLTKSSTVGIIYRFKDKNSDDEEGGHLVKASYSFSF